MIKLIQFLIYDERITNKILFFIALTICQGSAAVTFLGTDATLDFDAPSGSFIKGGIQVTLAASDGNVNATTSGLGINDSGSGDDTDGIDTINVVEILTISFDQDVIFNTISLSDVGSDDALDASFNGAAATSLSSSGLQTFNIILSAGDFLTLTATEPNSPVANNGVVINEFTVTAIPEPSSSALLGLGCLAMFLRRKR